MFANKHSCCLEPYMAQQTQIPAVVSSHPYRAAWALAPHPEAPVAHSWLAGLAQSLVHSPAFLTPLVTSLVLQTQLWHCLGAPGWQSWPHSAADSHSRSCYFTRVKYWQFCFLAGALKFSLLFHCLNHWNEYTTEPKNSCLRETAATKLCQWWHTTETQAVEAAQQ